MKTELESRKDTFWMRGYFALAIAVVPLMCTFVVPALVAKSVSLCLAMVGALVGYVFVQCARQLERVLAPLPAAPHVVGGDEDRDERTFR
ncbi:hypothetical protein Cch01nite_09800 [Cellulomonas chitinilytica]|uniref:Uncharacterized protein n=2 Tax=Cellulomonas chitinilytica TaxID=398759 RepID=A0A919U0A3_9CELL|nr:hypothetical protein Cch01nite_09800 [Cellulomonas chitinilytica]